MSLPVVDRWRHVEARLTHEQFVAMPNLLDVAIENTFPTSGSEKWSAMRLILDDVLIPLVIHRPRVAFSPDFLYLMVQLEPGVLLVNESVRDWKSGIVLEMSPYEVEYGHLVVQFVTCDDFPSFDGAVIVRFEARTVDV